MAPKIAAGWARPPSLTLSRACRHTPRVVTVQPRDRGSSRHGRATGGIEIRRRSLIRDIAGGEELADDVLVIGP